MESFGDAHGCREADNHMNVVGHHTEFNDNDVMSIRDFPKNILAKFFDILILEHVVSVFGAPFQMVYILAYAMVIVN
jgi:hypothetical protein